MRQDEIRMRIVEAMIARDVSPDLIWRHWNGITVLTQAIQNGKFPRRATQDEIDDAQLGPRHD